MVSMKTPDEIKDEIIASLYSVAKNTNDYMNITVKVARAEALMWVIGIEVK